MYATVPNPKSDFPRIGSLGYSMGVMVMDGEPPKPFAAYFRGHTISCETVEDAVAIIRADSVFRDGEVSQPRELERLAAVLTKYNQRRFAESLLRQASRLRAAEYLLQLTGFELPRRQARVG